MQILLGLIVGAVVGIALHFVLPQRDTRGVAVGPMIGAAAAAVVWTALTWAGFATDNPWLWLSAIIVPAVVTAPVLWWISASRVRSDAAERARLKIG